MKIVPLRPLRWRCTRHAVWLISLLELRNVDTEINSISQSIMPIQLLRLFSLSSSTLDCGLRPLCHWRLFSVFLLVAYSVQSRLIKAVYWIDFYGWYSLWKHVQLGWALVVMLGFEAWHLICLVMLESKPVPRALVDPSYRSLHFATLERSRWAW